jgi:PilZ domain
MTTVEARRASRHHVRWPARVRSITESKWHAGQVLNLSVTGALLELEQPYEIGERVEVEIDFLAQPDCKTVVTGVGYVVREHRGEPYRAAVHFDLGCRPGPRASEPAARDARP